MQITTKVLLKGLPFDDAFRAELSAQWQNGTEDQKIAVIQFLWDAYARLYQVRFETNRYLALLEIAQGKKDNLDKNLFKVIREKTDKEMEEQLASGTSAPAASPVKEEQSSSPENPTETSN